MNKNICNVGIFRKTCFLAKKNSFKNFVIFELRLRALFLKWVCACQPIKILLGNFCRMLILAHFSDNSQNFKFSQINHFCQTETFIIWLPSVTSRCSEENGQKNHREVFFLARSFIYQIPFHNYIYEIRGIYNNRYHNVFEPGPSIGFFFEAPNWRESYEKSSIFDGECDKIKVKQFA